MDWSHIWVSSIVFLKGSILFLRFGFSIVLFPTLLYVGDGAEVASISMRQFWIGFSYKGDIYGWIDSSGINNEEKKLWLQTMCSFTLPMKGRWTSIKFQTQYVSTISFTVDLGWIAAISFTLMSPTGTTTCFTRSNCLLWTNPVTTSDCSSLEEDATSRCSSFAGNPWFIVIQCFYFELSFGGSCICLFTCTCMCTLGPLSL